MIVPQLYGCIRAPALQTARLPSRSGKPSPRQANPLLGALIARTIRRAMTQTWPRYRTRQASARSRQPCFERPSNPGAGAARSPALERRVRAYPPARSAPHPTIHPPPHDRHRTHPWSDQCRAEQYHQGVDDRFGGRHPTDLDCKHVWYEHLTGQPREQLFPSQSGRRGFFTLSKRKGSLASTTKVACSLSFRVKRLAI